MKETALIVGAGPGLSSSLTTLLIKNGFRVALAARNTDKLSTLGGSLNVDVYPCDASSIDQVQSLFQKLDKTLGTPDLVIYNPSARVRGGIVEVDPEDTQKAINITCFGAFLVAQEAAKGWLSEAVGVSFSQEHQPA